MPAESGGEGLPQGLSWSWQLDFGALLAALNGAAPAGASLAGRSGQAPAGLSGAPPSGPPPSGSAPAGSPGTASCGTVPAGDDPAGGPANAADSERAGDGGGTDGGVLPGPVLEDEEAAQEQILDDLERYGEPRVPVAALAGRVAEQLAPGPDLAAWLAAAPVTELTDEDLAAAAGSWRRLGSWAQANELAAVAQITARAAARNEQTRTGDDRRPFQVPASAAAEVALELTMSPYSAAAWADLAVELTWRLAATGAALAAGIIDVPRARLITEATTQLSEDHARAVEARVLPAAGTQTTGMLRAALRRAVLAIDPAGAEQRRKDAERRARVVLYPDQDQTATLAGQRMPVIHAAAAMARIKAMARAQQADGADGPLDLLCAQIYIALLLGTPTQTPPPHNPPPGHPHGGNPPGHPYHDPGGPDHPGDDGEDPGGNGEDPGGTALDLPADDMPGEDVPPPGDQDAPRPEDDYPCPDDRLEGRYRDDDDADSGTGKMPVRNWPDLPETIPPAFTRPGARPPDGRPPAGLLDISLPWETLTATSPAPGHLGRIGPVTATQARQLAAIAATDPGTEWRIIITTSAGHALAVTRIPRPRPRPPGAVTEPGARAAPGAHTRPGERSRESTGTGLVGRVTLTIPEDTLTHPPPRPEPEPAAGTGEGTGPPGPPGQNTGQILGLALRAATRARAAMAADTTTTAGCAHTTASPGYRPPPRLKEYITARDLTCRFPRCRQPAWRGDLDHTIPFDNGGLTCRCNLGGLCRSHHLLKHHPDWKLAQTTPGHFTWTTPSGRTHTTTPDTHPL